MKPDVAGFREAQSRKRQELGEDVVFLGEVLLTFPEGTRIDPEAGRPYDPTVQPTASGQASASVRCGVAFRPVTEDATATAAGWTDESHVMLNAPYPFPGEWLEFRLRGARYKIVSIKSDAIGEGDPWRTIIQGRRE